MEDVAFWQLTGYTDVALPALFRIFAGLGSIAIMSFFSNRGENFWGQENSRTEKKWVDNQSGKSVAYGTRKGFFFCKAYQITGVLLNSLFFNIAVR